MYFRNGVQRVFELLNFERVGRDADQGRRKIPRRNPTDLSTSLELQYDVPELLIIHGSPVLEALKLG